MRVFVMHFSACRITYTSFPICQSVACILSVSLLLSEYTPVSGRPACIEDVVWDAGEADTELYIRVLQA